MSIPADPIPEEKYERHRDTIYVTETLIEQYHTVDGLARFQRWASSNTQLLIRGTSVYFPADYEQWIKSGLPDQPDLEQ